MDLSKSLRVVMAMNGTKNKDLAKVLSVREPTVSVWRQGGAISRINLERVCKHFDMTVIEFIALGEDQ